MMDNLYLDKLKGRITDSEYDRFYQSFRNEVIQINTRLASLQQAENDYFITAKYVLDLLTCAYELFISSDVEERRQFINLVCSNLIIEDDKVLWELRKPFDLILNCSDNLLWRD
ncbi:MAG: hypothetical protein P4L22_02150 [Candidatus Babeliales bacterium]|nr:hypothetical protein [Candidatus Babeliales bacterium]